MRSPGKQNSGFTLIEALLAATVLAIAVTAILLPFSAGARSQLVGSRLTLAVSLAEDMMEEILLREFEEPDDGDDDPEPTGAFGPDAGESDRDDFDAIDDYHGYEEDAGAIVGPGGLVVDCDEADGLSRHVTVEYVTVSGQAAEDDKTFLRVIVEVRHDGAAVVTLTRLVHWLGWRTGEET